MTIREKNRKLLSATELSSFCMQLSWIVKAGISVQEGIEMMTADIDNSQGRDILSLLQSSLEEGSGLALALQKTRCFPEYMVHMVEIGETSGRLEEALESLGEYYERSHSIAKSLRYAVTYPAIMIVMMGIVIWVLIQKVLPIFKQVFSQLGSEISGSAQHFFNFGELLGRYSFGLILLILAGVLLFAVLRNTKVGKSLTARLLKGSFITKRLSAKISAGRFASAMAMTLASGLDIDQSIEMSEQILVDSVIKEKITRLKKQMAEGDSFGEAVAKAEIFSVTHGHMILVGFKTGSVEQVMSKIARWYEDEVQEEIIQLLSIIEPTLVAVLAVIVGMVLLSVMLPLMGIMTSIG